VQRGCAVNLRSVDVFVRGDQRFDSRSIVLLRGIGDNGIGGARKRAKGQQ
jgi:hypothetical protein